MYKETREELIQMLEECQTEHHKRNLEVQRLQKALDAYPHDPNSTTWFQAQVDWYWEYAAPNIVGSSLP